MLHFYSGCCCKARLDLDFLCLGGWFVSSTLMKVLPVSPTDKPGSPCPCFSCAVLGQLPSFRGQEADLEAESGDPEPPKAAAALPGECAVFPCWDGPPDWAAGGGSLRWSFGFNSSFPLVEFINPKLFLPKLQLAKSGNEPCPLVTVQTSWKENWMTKV